MAQMADEDNIVITPAKPLDAGQLEIVNFHKMLTKCWRENSLYKSGLAPKVTFGSDDSTSYHSSFGDDVDLDAQLETLLENTDSSLIPDELIYTNTLDGVNHHVEHSRPSKHKSSPKLSAKLLKIEIKENAFNLDKEQMNMDRRDSEDATNRASDFASMERRHSDNLFISETEDAVGDYKYSFCEEEDVDHDIV